MPRPRALRELKTEHLECRSWMHAWEHSDTLVLKGTGLIELRLQCLRCETYRRDKINRLSGDVESRIYVHPGSYLVNDIPSWGGRKVFNGNVRLELIGRLTSQTTVRRRRRRSS